MPDYVDKVFDYSNDAWNYSYGLVKYTYGLVKSGANTVKEAYSPPPPPPPPPPPSQSYISLIDRFKTISGLPLVIVGGTGILYHFYNKYYSQRVRKAQISCKSGERFEIVLIVGSPQSIVVQKLIRDLNQTGYIVYVSVINELEVSIIENEEDSDIRPLLINFESEASVKSSLLRLINILKQEDGDGEYKYSFKGCLIFPDYFKFPKCKKMDDLNRLEFDRMFSTHFFNLNMLLQNGVLKLLKDSNLRKQQQQEKQEKQKSLFVNGGYSKLIFCNFIPISKNENRKLMLNLTLSMNKLLYDGIYKDNMRNYKPFWKNILNFTNIMRNPDYIDMTMLNINFYKDDESKLVSNRSLSSYITFNSSRTKKITTRRVHHKIYDLLNSQFLFKEYSISN
ncbi:hypothetical protein CANARDRAFT_201839 [[Candida] arabinofermentans NRRL YB-2248]|uniref:Uncharacterized protein n=1 Tax=[Candida] arabinofermentans NRRL YB-2248 TaxID=983967 RepID=A0A1E4SWW7_9ASCO|nr:hypothetical protein CANARDRAFT_201839 [[Candida] arabinofermentans NRRL YB-2248]